MRRPFLTSQYLLNLTSVTANMFLVHILFLIVLSSACEAARILAVIPTPSISHQVVFRPLTQELVKRGHEVVVITTDPAFPKDETPENLTEVDIHDISYKLWRDEVLSSAITSGRSDDILTQMKTMMPLLSKIFEIQMLTDQVQQVIRNSTNHFDLLLVEPCVRPAISVSHVFKAPVIFVSSFGGLLTNYALLGVPIHPPLIYPTLLRQKIFNLSLWEKVEALYHHYLLESIITKLEDFDNRLAKRIFGPDTPQITDLENNVHMMFLNIHPLWELNRPVPPSVIFMGGMHQKPSKELPQALKSYLDNSKNGVIYISYGTNVNPSSLPPEKIQMLIKVFSKLPYDILWKWDKDELPGRSANIRISKWLPQSDLLKHPKVKLFITQGGLQSTDEAITAGVPLIGMPMLGDQWYNVEQYVYQEIGIRMDMETLSEDKFLSGINRIVNDDSYRKNVMKLRKIMRDQPQTPLERAVWWAEHVIRHGGAPHLRASAANMSWSEYLDLQLMAALALASLAGLAAFSASLYFVIVFIRSVVLTGAKLKSS